MKVRLRGRRKERHYRLSLPLIFSLVVFVILFATLGLVTAVLTVLLQNGVITFDGGIDDVRRLILFMAIVSTVIGSVITFFFCRIPLGPVNKIMDALNVLASGDYKTRLSFGGPLAGSRTSKELCDSFNRLADELDHTEMLRSDFINNFSHEFKTPIVSIAGFAGLLKHGNLDEAQRREYVGIIEEESRRLADMATNVLNMTKIDNQTILTGVSSFNLSEQIRNCVLLLEDKWSKKEIDFVLDFEEFTIEGSEELLKQVWINLLDNAVKFVTNGGTIDVVILSDGEEISVAVGNTGSTVPDEMRERIFRKFYQADESHTAEGNGIGLAIVKKIAELHGGDVSVASGDGKTTFTVVLPVHAIEG